MIINFEKFLQLLVKLYMHKNINTSTSNIIEKTFMGPMRLYL